MKHCSNCKHRELPPYDFPCKDCNRSSGINGVDYWYAGIDTIRAAIVTVLMVVCASVLIYVAHSIKIEPVAKNEPFVIITKSGSILTSGDVYVTTITNGKIKTRRIEL